MKFLTGAGIAALCLLSDLGPALAQSENVIVTATRLPMQDASSNVSVIDATAIAARGSASAVDLLRDLPGVFVQQSGGRGSVVSVFTRGAKPNFTDNADEAATFQKIYNEMSKPLPLVPAEDQFENTVGKAMNDMFAKIATGGTVSDADIKSALSNAQDQVKQSLGG